jgi:hypothetical protein
MVISGAQPTQRQYVAFEAKGVLRDAPEKMRKVELARDDQRVSLFRKDEQTWITASGITLDGATAKQISVAVQMMHNSAPVREIPAIEVADTDPAAFGLDRPRLIASFYLAAAEPVLIVRFGGRNADDFLQYMRIENDDRLYLMSRFIGEAWSNAFSSTVRQ